MKDNEKDLYEKLVCAVLHDIKVCDECDKCDGCNGPEKRMNLVKDLAEYMGEELPWLMEDK